jgi:hypothetical protein
MAAEVTLFDALISKSQAAFIKLLLYKNGYKNWMWTWHDNQETISNAASSDRPVAGTTYCSLSFPRKAKSEANWRKEWMGVVVLQTFFYPEKEVIKFNRYSQPQVAAPPSITFHLNFYKSMVCCWKLSS